MSTPSQYLYADWKEPYLLGVSSFQVGFMDVPPLQLLRAPLFLRILLELYAWFSALLSHLKILNDF